MHICWVWKNNTWTNTYSCFSAQGQNFRNEFSRRFQTHNAFKLLKPPLFPYASNKRENNRNRCLYCSDDDDGNDDDMIKFKFCVYTWNCIQAIRTMAEVKWTSFEHETQRKHTFHLNAMMSLVFFLLHIYHYPALLVGSFSPHSTCIGLRFCYCVSVARCRLEREVLHAVTHWSALGSTRHAPHRISFHGETMATSPPVRQQSTPTTFAPSAKTTNTRAYHSSRARLHKDPQRCVRMCVQLFIWCTVQSDQTRKISMIFFCVFFSFGVVRFECCIDKRCKHVTLLDKNLIKWKRDFMVFI